jgi:hypothetical protein
MEPGAFRRAGAHHIAEACCRAGAYHGVGACRGLKRKSAVSTGVRYSERSVLFCTECSISGGACSSAVTTTKSMD